MKNNHPVEVSKSSSDDRLTNIAIPGNGSAKDRAINIAAPAHGNVNVDVDVFVEANDALPEHVLKNVETIAIKLQLFLLALDFCIFRLGFLQCGLVVPISPNATLLARISHCLSYTCMG
jgi:hypothetical protein